MCGPLGPYISLVNYFIFGDLDPSFAQLLPNIQCVHFVCTRYLLVRDLNIENMGIERSRVFFCLSYDGNQGKRNHHWAYAQSMELIL